MKSDVSETYFSLFNLPPQFELDLGALEKTYFALQRQYHPDRFVKKSEEERKQALSLSMQINDAYHTLKDPLNRAKYLLHLNGIEVNGERDTLKPSQGLLMELMELRERLETGDVALKPEVQALLDKAGQALAASFAAQDLTAAAHQAIRLNYLNKLTRDIELAGMKTAL